MHTSFAEMRKVRRPNHLGGIDYSRLTFSFLFFSFLFLGPGCFIRIKEHMRKHITKEKTRMYRKASNRVQKELGRVFEANRKELTESSHNIVAEMQKDFELILSNSEVLEASEVARDHIRGVLQGVDARFGSILAGKLVEVGPAQPHVAEPQQLVGVSMADVDTVPGGAAEAAEAVASAENVAMDTT
jgi:hypothetical protein